MRRFLLVLILAACICLTLTPFANAEDGQIRGVAFLTGEDGLYREGGRTLAGVTVSLYRLDESDGETLAGRAQTGADGAYGFTGLAAGRYRLRAVLPEGNQFALPRAGGSVMLPNAGTGSFSLPISLSAGEAVLNAHIGATRGSTYIKAIAFEDANQNGGRSTAELLLRGVEITLYYEMDGEPVAVAAARTDQNGEALFLHLTPGTYRVGASLPAPYIIGPLGEKTSLWYNCVPPCDGSAGLTGPVTAVKGDSLGVGVGAVRSGGLTGRIWWDENMDGRMNGIENGFAGASVRLESGEAGVSREITTAASGAYRFEGLLEGRYTLTVSLPETAMFTLPGGDSLFTKGYAFTASCTVDVKVDETAEVPEIGVMPATSVTVQVYHDVNVNGAFDEGEPVFAGAELEALENDLPRASAVSDGEGVARIPVLRGGERELRLRLPDGEVFTVEGDQSDFYDLSATGDLTMPFTVPHGQELRLYAGVTLPAAVSGQMFNDENLSGVREADEAGLAGFQVLAVNAAGETVAQTVTDENGCYSFRRLLPAAHTVRFCLSEAYVCTDFSDTGAEIENNVVFQTPEYGETAPLSLTPGQRVENLCCGVFRSATVTGCVAQNTGVDGLPAEGGIENVRVTLIGADGNPVSGAAAVTDETGAFYLKGALPGDYRLRYTLPDGAVYTDTAISGRDYESAPFPLRVGEDRRSDAVYAVYTGSLRGAAYRDAGLNGARDADETPLAGVQLTMEHLDLGLRYEAVSDASGRYALTGLRPGAYRLRVTLPDGLCFAWDPSSPIPAGVRATGQSLLSVGVGEALEDRDIAAAAPASLSGTVYYDLLNNGPRDADDPGAEGVTLSFTGSDSPLSYTVRTDADGAFRLDAMVPGAYSLRVTLPDACIAADHSAATLADGYWTSSVRLTDGMTAGLQYPILRYARVAGRVWSLDGSRNGVAGRTVRLYAGDAAVPLAERVTDEAGAFSFDQLKPGQYRLSCDLPDARYAFARPADAALHPGRTDIPVGDYGAFTVEMGAQMTACDIGIGAMGALGDTAWLDLNRNGLQEGDEPCLPGVEIELYQYGSLAAAAVTDSQGRYLVENLYPGAYTVRVRVPDGTRPTVRRTDFPLAASVLEQTDEAWAEAQGVIVPSAGRSLNCDFGFVLLRDGVYPAELRDRYTIDWSFGGKRK